MTGFNPLTRSLSGCGSPRVGPPNPATVVRVRLQCAPLRWAIARRRPHLARQPAAVPGAGSSGRCQRAAAKALRLFLSVATDRQTPRAGHSATLAYAQRSPASRSWEDLMTTKASHGRLNGAAGRARCSNPGPVDVLEPVSSIPE